jgi:hypothetical protein
MNNDNVFCLWLASDGVVFCADRKHMSGYFTKTELEGLKNAIDKTLGYYELQNITDDFIKEQDDAQKNQELKKWENSGTNVYQKEKVDDLYLILDEDSNHLKIGRSKNVKARLNQLQTANSHKLKLLYSLPEKGYLENEIHDVFKRLKVKDEWFINDGKIIDYFEVFLL